MTREQRKYRRREAFKVLGVCLFMLAVTCLTEPILALFGV